MTHRYDEDSREISTDTGSQTYSTVYDALGRVTSQSWDTENAITTQYTYQAGKNGSQSSQVKKLTNGAGETSYTYDANGNITSLVSESETASYVYDELNQLIREDSSERSQTITYVYDLGGNLKKKRIYSYQPSATDEELAQSEATDAIVYGYDATWKDKLVSYDGQDITYDALGNPLSYRGMTMTWSKARELYSLKKSGITYRYRYDSDGMRTNKFLSNGTVTYQIEGNLIVGEQKVDSTGALVYELEFLYDSSGNVLGMVYNGEEYYYEKNLQGDIVGLMDGTGTRIATYKYDSWGKTLRIFGSNAELGKINPFRYRSYYYDRETGLFYLNSRYYDPEVGRFLSADTTDVLTVSKTSLKEKNLYAYCNNSPIVYKDVTGTIAETVFDIATLALSAVEVTMNPTDLTAWAGLLGDAVDLIPFVTGVGETIKALRASSKIAEGTADAIDAYSSLRKINKGIGKEVHHIIEKRFAKNLNLGKPSKMLSIALDKNTHRKYTNAWRATLSYGKKYNTNQVVKAAAKVYADNPRLMGVVVFSLMK